MMREIQYYKRKLIDGEWFISGMNVKFLKLVCAFMPMEFCAISSELSEQYNSRNFKTPLYEPLYERHWILSFSAYENMFRLSSNTKKSPCKMYKFEWNFEQNECQILVLEWFVFAIHNHYDHMPLIIPRKAMTFKVMVLEKKPHLNNQFITECQNG